MKTLKWQHVGTKPLHFSPVWKISLSSPSACFLLKGMRTQHTSCAFVPECRKHKVFGIFQMDSKANLGLLVDIYLDRITSLHQDNQTPFTNSYEDDLRVRWKANMDAASSAVASEQ